jgi:DNA repair photolyase
MAERIQGRGAAFNPGNRFEILRIDDLSDELEGVPTSKIPTIYYKDSSRSILAKNDSPDVPFTFSVNPYRGCEHGCIYCYARPSHEYLGFSAGLDFETKIMVKMDAPQLLAEELSDPKFEPQVIALCGNTDCYQPVEKKLQLTRGCLQQFLRFRNPVGVITKNSMVTRDIDVLQELARFKLVHVTLSITSMNPKLISRMEPRTASPENRMKAVKALSDAGIPVGVNVAPVIPGLTDSEIPEILKQAADHGAKSAAYIIMRLPYAVKDLFEEWVRRALPDSAEKILNRIREVRGGKLSDPRFHSRMTGEGELANTIKALFAASCKKYGLNNDDEDDEEDDELTTEHFVRAGQMSLF